MPFRDQTGPNGEGSMTGRGLGKCNKESDTLEQPRLGLGRQTGRGRGMGRNRRPIGRGRRNQGR